MIVAVCVIGNLPLAVGTIASICSQGNYKGKCVEILHCYRDELWMMHQAVPNDGFKIEIVDSFIEYDNAKNEDSNENYEKNKEDLKESEQISHEDIQKIEKVLEENEISLVGSQNNEDKGMKISEINAIEEINREDHDITNMHEEVIKESLEIASDELELIKDDIEIKIENEKTINETQKELSEYDREIQEEKIEYKEIIEKEQIVNEENVENKEIIEEEKNENLGTDTEERKNSFDRFTESKSPDELLLIIFLTALKIGITDTMLPLEPSSLLDYMKRSKRNLDLNFSQTSYKKIGKFLQHAHSLNIIIYEKPKSHDHKLITSINRKNELFQDFIPLVSKLKSYPQDNYIEDQKIKETQYPIVTFAAGFIPKNQFSYIFTEIFEKTSKAFITKNEINTILQNYITIKGLECTKDTVKLDKSLQKALKCEETIKKSELFKNFKNLFEQGYIEEFTSGLMPSNIKIGSIPCISLCLDKSKYSKVVTKIKGCDDYHLDIGEILTTLKKSLAASASFTELTSGKKVKIEIQVQGDHLDKVSKLLSDNFQIPKSCIIINRSR